MGKEQKKQSGNTRKSITKEDIKQSVDYIFREKPVENTKKGLGDFIDVYEDKDQLSFCIKMISTKNDRQIKFMTGIGGFINQYNMIPGLMELLPVRLNGQVLEGELVDTFWEEFYKIRKKYIDEK